MAAAMATGEAWFKVPESIKFIYYGQPSRWVGGKDFILHAIGDIGVDGARYMSMEFTGEAIRGLSMDNRFSMANMAIEAGGKNGIIAADEITMAYIKGRSRDPTISINPMRMRFMPAPLNMMFPSWNRW